MPDQAGLVQGHIKLSNLYIAPNSDGKECLDMPRRVLEPLIMGNEVKCIPTAIWQYVPSYPALHRHEGSCK